MFLGHYALALGAKRSTPRTSLGVLIAAAQFPDLLWPVFLLLGWEHVAPGDHGFTTLSFTDYPWSHSLVMVVGWSLLAGAVYWLWRRGDRRGAIWVPVLVLSHWLLDYGTHLPDLPLYPGGPERVGLGLWRHPAATILIEGAMWVGGLALYLKTTRARDRTGVYAFWSLIALLVFIYIGNILAEPPADMRNAAWGAMAGLIVPFWAAWADRHREAV